MSDCFLHQPLSLKPHAHNSVHVMPFFLQEQDNVFHMLVTQPQFTSSATAEWAGGMSDIMVVVVMDALQLVSLAQVIA